jgi:GNAT superfamily N-acetyltransferase
LSLSNRFSGVAIRIRLGDAADVDAAVSVFEQSNLARRQAVWPNRAARVERVRTHLRDPASWFLVADEGSALVGMASAEALRGEDGAGPAIPGGCFLSYLFIVPERWGEGIGGLILDAVLAEAKRRHYSRIHLWTHEDNERSRRLYRSRGFSPTGRTGHGEGEWAREILTRT